MVAASSRQFKEPRQKQASDATSSTTESITSNDNSPNVPLNRKSMIDRARVFDPSFVDPSSNPGKRNSKSKKSGQGLTLQELLDNSDHRKLLNVTDGKRPTYRQGNINIDGSVIVDPPKPGMVALLDASQHRKEANITDGRRQTYRPNRATRKSDGTFSLIPRLSNHGGAAAKPKHFPVGPNMQALLDGSKHRKSLHVSSVHRAQQSSKSFRVKPPLPSNVTPMPPTETTFQNVKAPKLTLDPKTFTAPIHPKTEFQMALIRKAIASQTYVLKNHNDETTQKLVDAMEPLEIASGEILQEQGQTDANDDGLYLVQDGSLEVEVDGTVVDTVMPGSCVGQERLLLRAKNKSTVRARENSVLFRLDQMTFRAIVQRQHLDTVQEEVQKPTVSALPETPEPPSPKATVSKKKRQQTKVQPSFAFEDSPVFVQQQAIRKAAMKYAASKDDLEFIKVLGEGQFGEVWLVAAMLPGLPSPLEERQEFALKIQQMDDETREDAEDAIHKEIHALQQLHHPFIVNLVHTYESHESIDMLLGLIPGGELWDEIHREDEEGIWTSGISESRAKFLTYTVADTLAFLHSREYVFRDLKPENIMIDNDGYPIIVDFGFTKHVPHGDKTFTFCGTPNYVSPEIVTNVGHGPPADFWALGVIIYEMISGENPFFYDGMEQIALFQSIVDDDPYSIEDDVEATDQVLDIIERFLIKDPTHRLGSTGVQEIMSHPWFKGMPPINEIRSKRVNAFDVGNYALTGSMHSLDDIDDDACSFADSDDDYEDCPPAPPMPVVAEITNSPEKEASLEERIHVVKKEKKKSVQKKHSPMMSSMRKNLSWTKAVNRTASFEKSQKERELHRRFSADDAALFDKDGGNDAEDRCKPDSIRIVKITFPRREKLLGYYVNRKSDAEKRDSEGRRSKVNDFLSQYLDGE